MQRCNRANGLTLGLILLLGAVLLAGAQNPAAGVSGSAYRRRREWLARPRCPGCALRAGPSSSPTADRLHWALCLPAPPGIAIPASRGKAGLLPGPGEPGRRCPANREAGAHARSGRPATDRCGRLHRRHRSRTDLRLRAFSISKRLPTCRILLRATSATCCPSTPAWSRIWPGRPMWRDRPPTQRSTCWTASTSAPRSAAR
jgi:hypothetical protein